MEKEESAKIIKSVAAALELNIKELANQLSVNQQQMYDYTMGKKLPGWGFWTKLKTTFPNVSAEFLFTGKGNVLND